MEGQITIFIKLWFQVLLSTWYCYHVAKVIPKGTTRLISISPVICHFLILPLNTSSFHFGIISSYFISWLANFKLLLFSFGVGPLSDPSISLGRFALLVCLPIKIKETLLPPKSPKKLKRKHQSNNITKQSNGLNNGKRHSTITSKGGLKSPLNYATKAFLSLIVLFIVAHTKDRIHPHVTHIIMGIYIYMSLEILLAAMGVVAQLLLGTSVEQQFGEPYLSSSLKDFWGRQWNLMSSDVLCLAIYKPILRMVTPVFGSRWALVPAILGTFLVSGFMHELIFYHAGRFGPTFGTTLFFLLNALFVLIEIWFSSFTGKWRLPRIISGPLILGLEIITFMWLVMPALLRWNIIDRAMDEYKAMGNFLIDLARSSTLLTYNTSSG